MVAKAIDARCAVPGPFGAVGPGLLLPATKFPAEYKGDAFVSLHGSWNAGKPTGYKVVRVQFRNGRPGGRL